MEKLVFASGNAHKLKELRDKVGNSFEVISMREIGFKGEIEEYGKTLEENAEIKARFIHDRYGVNAFADDSGLEIDALNGEPGVYSARFAGPGCSFDDNNQKVLKLMKDIELRTARFRTVIHLILNGEHYRFQGAIEGTITKEHSGSEGFGYDPIFQPSGYSLTFAQMDLDQKNQISHRAKAVESLITFLRENAS